MSGTTQDLGFLLDDFRDRVPNVAHMVALSADGLLVASDRTLDRDVADRLAAAASGLVSLLRVAGDVLGAGGLSHNMTEYGNGYLLTMSAGTGGCLVVLADPRCDLGTVSYEMTALVNRVGDALVPSARTALAMPAGHPR